MLPNALVGIRWVRPQNPPVAGARASERLHQRRSIGVPELDDRRVGVHDASAAVHFACDPIVQRAGHAVPVERLRIRLDHVPAGVDRIVPGRSRDARLLVLSQQPVSCQNGPAGGGPSDFSSSST